MKKLLIKRLPGTGLAAGVPTRRPSPMIPHFVDEKGQQRIPMTEDDTLAQVSRLGGGEMERGALRKTAWRLRQAGIPVARWNAAHRIAVIINQRPGRGVEPIE